MIEWFKDFFGINKYAVVWDFVDHGIRLQGSNAFAGQGGCNKRHATSIAKGLNAMYNLPNSHWIEKL